MPAMTIELQKANRFNECMLYYITKKRLEAAGGVEPPNNGFANRRLRPLGYAAAGEWFYSLIRLYLFSLLLHLIDCNQPGFHAMGDRRLTIELLPLPILLHLSFTAKCCEISASAFQGDYIYPARTCQIWSKFAWILIFFQGRQPADF